MADPAPTPVPPVPPAARRRRRLVGGALAVVTVGVVATVTAVAVLNDQDDDAGTGTAAPASSTATRSATRTASADAGLPPAAPTQTPEPTAADLTGDDLPAPAALGPGWTTQALVDDAEEGIVGNGTPYQQRDPADAVGLLLPLGCAQRSELPLPEAVLEASYRHDDGVPAVGLRLRMADADEAARLVAVLIGDLRACRDQPTDETSGAGPPVAEVGAAGDAVTSLRVDPFQDDPAERWSEVLLAARDDVLVVAVNLAPDDPRYVGPERLAAALRDLGS